MDHRAPPRPRLPRPLTPPRHATSTPSRSLFERATKNVHFGEDIDFVVGVTATAFAANQLLKLKDSEKHKTTHLVAAGLGASTAAAAFSMMKHEHHERHQNNTQSGHTRHRGSDLGHGTGDSRISSRHLVESLPPEQAHGSYFPRTRR